MLRAVVRDTVARAWLCDAAAWLVGADARLSGAGHGRQPMGHAVWWAVLLCKEKKLKLMYRHVSYRSKTTL